MEVTGSIDEDDNGVEGIQAAAAASRIPSNEENEEEETGNCEPLEYFKDYPAVDEVEQLVRLLSSDKSDLLDQVSKLYKCQCIELTKVLEFVVSLLWVCFQRYHHRGISGSVDEHLRHGEYQICRYAHNVAHARMVDRQPFHTFTQPNMARQL
jgi:hypothetical protein